MALHSKPLGIRRYIRIIEGIENRGQLFFSLAHGQLLFVVRGYFSLPGQLVMWIGLVAASSDFPMCLECVNSLFIRIPLRPTSTVHTRESGAGW